MEHKVWIYVHKLGKKKFWHKFWPQARKLIGYWHFVYKNPLLPHLPALRPRCHRTVAVSPPTSTTLLKLSSKCTACWIDACASSLSKVHMYWIFSSSWFFVYTIHVLPSWGLWGSQPTTADLHFTLSQDFFLVQQLLQWNFALKCIMMFSIEFLTRSFHSGFFFARHAYFRK